MISKNFANDIIDYIKMISFFEFFKTDVFKPKKPLFPKKGLNIVIF